MPAGSATVYHSIKTEILKGLVDFEAPSDLFKIALITDAYTPAVSDGNWAQVEPFEVVGAGYVAGGQTIQNNQVVEDPAGDRSYWDGDDIVWNPTTLTARWAVIYEDRGGAAAANPLVGWIDFGENETTVAAPFLIVFNASGILELR